MSAGRPVFPFSAIVGQASLKRALVLNAVDPSIGGALIRGDKGTAKSTAVRALAALLPPLAVVEGCPFRCAPESLPAACPWCVEHAGGPLAAATELNGTSRPWGMRPVPLVELPLSATEDRVAGSIDLEAAIQRGARRFEPGLLAAANRGILYVDEVNLLPDHLVDVVLDAAAGGVHRVEREGVSVVHSARFVLVGTMNPEEGELRPQLLDRFGLAADVITPRDPVDRAAVVRRRIAFDADPLRFTALWTDADRKLGAEITAARGRLPAVQIDDTLLDLIARICVAYEVDGLRADIVIYKASAALAALDGRDRATAADVRSAAELALPHRRRRDPFEESGFDPGPLDRLTDEHATAGDPSDAYPGESGSGRADGQEQHDAAPRTTGRCAARLP
ncbi:MAG: ATP-binding protein, partial [Chloroflexota bacterium]|nr:ATP-binding protein [Chloroflexota bacterium]